MKKKKKIECIECFNDCIIEYKDKTEISFCPFCGEEISVIVNDDPLLNSFEKLDEFNDLEDV